MPLCILMLRLHFEYCIQFWWSHLKKDIVEQEKVQKRMIVLEWVTSFLKKISLKTHHPLQCKPLYNVYNVNHFTMYKFVALMGSCSQWPSGSRGVISWKCLGTTILKQHLERVHVIGQQCLYPLFSIVCGFLLGSQAHCSDVLDQGVQTF